MASMRKRSARYGWPCSATCRPASCLPVCGACSGCDAAATWRYCCVPTGMCAAAGCCGCSHRCCCRGTAARCVRFHAPASDSHANGLLSLWSFDLRTCIILTTPQKFIGVRMDNDEKVLGEPEAMAEGEAAEEQQTVQDVQPAGENGQPEVEASSAGEPAVAQEAPDTPPDDAPEADEVAAPLEAEPEAEAAVPVDAGEVDEEPELTDEQVFLQYISGEGAVEGTVALIEKGQLVTGTITSISDQQIYVDIGAKTEGVIQSRDLGRLDREVIDALEVGQEIQVYVLTLEGPGDHPVLSLSRALEEQDWEQAEAYLVSKEAYASRITGYNKGGLIVPFGRIRGFVPASQVSMERRRRDGGEQPSDRWGSMVGEEISVKVIEVDRGRNRLILSERAAAQEQRARRRQELFEEQIGRASCRERGVTED